MSVLLLAAEVHIMTARSALAAIEGYRISSSMFYVRGLLLAYILLRYMPEVAVYMHIQTGNMIMFKSLPELANSEMP
jgi:hypothetical protein